MFGCLHRINISNEVRWLSVVWLGLFLYLGEIGTSEAASTGWQSGLMLDFSYSENLSNEQPKFWSSKLTSNRLEQFAPNMAMAYLRKLQDEDSPWGMEVALQGGFDTDGLVPGQQKLAGYSWLRYLARANLSYRVPLGNGINLSAGLMNSFFGIESMWSRDNNHYSRSWMADYSPYYLIGIGGQYPVNDELQVGMFLLNDYDYLAYKTTQPKYATQVIWTINQHWKYTHNLFAGSEQRSDPSGWRYFSDSIVQWSAEPLTVAWAFDSGTQTVVQQQALWLASMISGRWQVQPNWAVALRPEIYWDADGLMTGQKQFIKGATATIEYKARYASLNSLWRMEYRVDDSRSQHAVLDSVTEQPQNIFGHQQLLLFSCVLSFDSQ